MLLRQRHNTPRGASVALLFDPPFPKRAIYQAMRPWRPPDEKSLIPLSDEAVRRKLMSGCPHSAPSPAGVRTGFWLLFRSVG